MTRPAKRIEKIISLRARIDREAKAHPVKIVPVITKLKSLMTEQLRSENRRNRCG